MAKGYKIRKIFDQKWVFFQMAKPNSEPHYIGLETDGGFATLYKNTSSKYHVPMFWNSCQRVFNETSHKTARETLQASREQLIQALNAAPLYRAFPKEPTDQRHPLRKKTPDLLFLDRLLRPRQSAAILLPRTIQTVFISIHDNLPDTTTSAYQRHRPTIDQGRCCAVPNVLSPRDLNIEPRQRRLNRNNNNHRLS